MSGYMAKLDTLDIAPDCLVPDGVLRFDDEGACKQA